APDAAKGPGADVLVADPAELPHSLEVPVEAFERAGIAHVDDVPAFIARGVQVLGVVQLEARVVGGERAGSDVSPLDSEAAVLKVPVREVIEGTCVTILDRATPERDESPRVPLPVEPSGVVGLPDVGAVPDRDEALEVEGHLLASDPHLQLAAREVVNEGDERLAQIERIFVDRRDDVLPRRAYVFQLDEDLPVGIG